MRSLLDDLRYAHRILIKAPAISAVAVTTLALGIGANTAIFSVADSILWKPLPLPQPDRLMMVMDLAPRQQSGWVPTSPGTFLDWRAQSQTFQHLAVWAYSSVNLTSAGAYGDEPEQLPALRVSESFFDVAGLKPRVGRLFAREEHQPGRDTVAVLSQKLWARRFNSDPSVVGKTIHLDRGEITITGVLPDGFEGPSAAPELYLPLAMTPRDRNARVSHNLFGIGRLKPRVPISQARAEMTGIAQRLARQYPESNGDWGVTLIPLRDFHMGGIASQIAMLLLGGAGFLVLMVCASVANIQFARATGRLREVAVRSALGASRGRVLRQLLTENLVLAAWGAAFGLLVAAWGIYLLRGLLPAAFAESLARWNGPRLDWRALAFTMACAAAAGILSGLAPAIQSARADVLSGLKLAGRSYAATRGSHRLRNVLAAAEVAIALVLLIGAGIMVKGFGGLVQKEQNLDPKSTLTMRLNLPASKYSKGEDVRRFYNELLARIQTLPGVESAATATAIPHSGVVEGIRNFTREGGPVLPPSERFLCILELVSPNYFQTMRIPLLKGRSFGPQDALNAPRAGIISRRMAERYWPGEDPLGKRVKLGSPNDDSPWITIAGVAADVVYNAYDREPRPALYLSQEQVASRSVHVVVRTAGRAADIAPAVRSAIRDVDRAQPVYQVKTLETLLAEQVSGFRLLAVVMRLFSLLALALALIGVYGVIAWSVTERTHEIGVRMALGAERGHVLMMVAARGVAVSALGAAVGTAAAYALARALSGMIYGVAPTDTATFVSVPALLVAVAVAATWRAAWKATKIDPVQALRSE